MILGNRIVNTSLFHQYLEAHLAQPCCRSNPASRLLAALILAGMVGRGRTSLQGVWGYRSDPTHTSPNLSWMSSGDHSMVTIALQTSPFPGSQIQIENGYTQTSLDLWSLGSLQINASRCQTGRKVVFYMHFFILLYFRKLGMLFWSSVYISQVRLLLSIE